MDNRQPEEGLQKIGKGFFANYYDLFERIFAEKGKEARTILRRKVVEYILDDWIDPNTGRPIGRDSCETRISNALRIIRDGLAKNALLNICESEKVALKYRKKALIFICSGQW